MVVSAAPRNDRTILICSDNLLTVQALELLKTAPGAATSVLPLPVEKAYGFFQDGQARWRIGAKTANFRPIYECVATNLEKATAPRRVKSLVGEILAPWVCPRLASV
jgi:hypothetical protein